MSDHPNKRQKTDSIVPFTAELPRPLIPADSIYAALSQGNGMRFGDLNQMILIYIISVITIAEDNDGRLRIDPSCSIAADSLSSEVQFTTSGACTMCCLPTVLN